MLFDFAEWGLWRGVLGDGVFRRRIGKVVFWDRGVMGDVDFRTRTGIFLDKFYRDNPWIRGTLCVLVCVFI